MDNEELKRTMTDAVLGRVYMQLGIPASKPVTSYVKAACAFSDNPDGSPKLTLVDPTTGIHHRDLDSFVASLKSDPDFRPKPIFSGGQQPVQQPVHVHVDDLTKVQPMLQDVVSGKVIVDWPEPQAVELKENEIAVRDQRGINEHIQELASGKMTIPDLVPQK